MKLPIANFTVLAMLSFAVSITVILSHSPSESDEPDQPLSSEAKRHVPEAVLLRITAKYQIARDVIVGRLSLIQAAALFGTLNQVPPQLVDWPWRVRFPADTDKKRLCRQVLNYVSRELDEEPDRREATMARLEADFKEERCEEGADLTLVLVEKLLAQARVELTDRRVLRRKGETRCSVSATQARFWDFEPSVAAVAGTGDLDYHGLAMAEEKTFTPDLKALADGKGGTIPADATLRWVEDAKGKPALKVQSKKDDTLILLDRIEFANGVIEFDALGQSRPRGSNFLGFAFRVVDAKTHDGVYFRPFNFRAEEAERKAHAVQYVSHPKYRWQVLRQDKPGQYEKPIVPAPDGDAWFHVRIVLQKPKVSVYVNDSQEPSLAVEELNDRKGGGVGLWVGPGQGGYLANLKITPAD